MFHTFETAECRSKLTCARLLEKDTVNDLVKNNHAEVIKLLVEAGADMNVEDSRGIIPLLLAGSAIGKMTSNEIHKYNSIVQTLTTAYCV